MSDISRRSRRSRRVLRTAALSLLAVAAMVTAAAATAAPATKHCKSADLRYPFRPGGPKLFGVFKLKITAGRCDTAHRVAKTWMRRFEAGIRAGHVRPPRSVDGFSFKTLPAKEPQEFREQGTSGTGTTIRFDYRVPNG